MIELDKKYRTRDGRAVRILCIDRKTPIPVDVVVGLVVRLGDGKELIRTWGIDGAFVQDPYLESMEDLVEVSIYDDWPIDVAVWSKTFADSFWIPRHFAGIHAETGKPLVWRDGYTGHTCRAADPHFAVLEARLASEFDPDEE